MPVKCDQKIKYWSLPHDSRRAQLHVKRQKLCTPVLPNIITALTRVALAARLA